VTSRTPTRSRMPSCSSPRTSRVRSPARRSTSTPGTTFTSVAALVRLAHAGDAESIAAIYEPYVRDTAISFEVEPPTADELRTRLRTVLAHAPWLVCERDGAVVGYAYAGRFHARAAYQWTVETTLYVGSADHRRGVGSALYAALLDALRAQGFRAAVGVIALPHPASV